MKQSIQIPHHGRVVDARLYVPDGAKVYPMVILSHGFGGHMSDFDALAQQLCENGIGALTLTFCGGSRQPTPGFATRQMTLFTEKEDLDAVLDLVKAMPSVDGKHIFLFGASQGGMVSSMVASGRPDDVAGLMLMFPALCIPDDWNTRYPVGSEIPEVFDLWGVELGRCYCETLRDFDVWGMLAGYRGPVVIWHGADDPVVNVSYAEKAKQAFENASLTVFPGEGHGFSPARDEQVYAEALAFVRAYS